MQFNVIMTSGANQPVEWSSIASIEKIHSDEIFQLNVEMMSMEQEKKKTLSHCGAYIKCAAADAAASLSA